MTELPGNRETAYRVFAAEFDDATVDYQEGDEERAPNYVVTPTGARANRLFVVGVLTEIESVNEDVLRARIVDPTGAFVVYAGQYQPDEMAALERLDPPAFVAVTGKARTFQPEDSDRVFTSVRPESINTVDAETRDRWVVRTAQHTVERVGTVAAAAELDATDDDRRAALEDRGVPAPTASGVSLALEHYGTTPAYLAGMHDLARDAAEVVAGDRDEVDADDRSPGDAGDGTHTYADLAAALGDAATTTTPDATDAAETTDATDAAETTDAGDAAGTTDAGDAAETTDATEAGGTTDAGTVDADAGATDEPASESDAPSEPADATASDDLETQDDAESADEEPATADEGIVDDVSAEEGTVGDAAGGDDVAAGADAPASDGDDDEGVGDFEPGSLGGGSDATGEQMYEFDEDEREEIEAEFGTEFSSGNDVPEPEESDLDSPDTEDLAEGDAAVDADDSGEAAPEADDGEEAVGDADDASEAADAGDDEPAEDVDLDAFVMDAMRDLNDGDGVDRDALLEHVSDETGADTDAVEEAVQDALMGGQCYEPEDGVLKPI